MRMKILDALRFLVYNFIDIFITRPEDATINDVLIVRVDAIGDYILFRNFLQVIHDSGEYKDKKLVMVGNIAWKEIAIELDSGLIDEFIWVDRKRFSRNLIYRYKTLTNISSKQYELVISPVHSRDMFYSDWIVKNVIANEKIGSAGDLSTMTEKQKNTCDHWFTKLLPAKNGVMFEFYRNKEFFENLLNKKLNITKPYIKLNFQTSALRLPDNYAVIFIGASSHTRKWPIENFSSIAQILTKKYSLKIVLCGGAGDIKDAEEFFRHFKGAGLNLVGKTSLVDLLYVIKNGRLMISNETSAPHLAVALDMADIFVISNGNHYGRFTPYPNKIVGSYCVIYPPEIEGSLDDYKQLCDTYGYGSDLNIKGISVKALANNIDKRLGAGH